VKEYYDKPDINGEPRGYWLHNAAPPRPTIVRGLRLLLPAAAKHALVVYGGVTVKGPAHNSLCTPCHCRQILVKTQRFRIVESELWTTLQHVLEDTEYSYNEAIPGCIAHQLKPSAAHGRPKRRRVEGAHEPTFDWLAAHLVKPVNVPVLARLMLEINTVDQVRADAGAKYRYSTAVTELRGTVHNLAHQLAYSA
jgi:hypothetical protein